VSLHGEIEEEHANSVRLASEVVRDRPHRSNDYPKRWQARALRPTSEPPPVHLRDTAVARHRASRVLRNSVVAQVRGHLGCGDARRASRTNPFDRFTFVRRA
jgi:hypothetical protein